MKTGDFAPNRCDRLLENRDLRLSRDNGKDARRRVNGGDESAVPGRDSALLRNRPVGVRRDPRNAVAVRVASQREGRFGELLPADIRGEIPG